MYDLEEYVTGVNTAERQQQILLEQARTRPIAECLEHLERHVKCDFIPRNPVCHIELVRVILAIAKGELPS
jgi:hypothetical protein